MLSLLLKTMSQRCVFGCQHCSFATLFAASFAASFAALFAAPRFAQQGISSPYVAMICLCGNFQVSQCCKRVCVEGRCIAFCHVRNFGSTEFHLVRGDDLCLLERAGVFVFCACAERQRTALCHFRKLRDLCL